MRVLLVRVLLVRVLLRVLLDVVLGLLGTLLLLDPAARVTVDPAALASRSRNSPYAGRELPGRVVATFLRGTPTVLDGKATR